MERGKDVFGRGKISGYFAFSRACFSIFFFSAIFRITFRDKLTRSLYTTSRFLCLFLLCALFLLLRIINFSSFFVRKPGAWPFLFFFSSCVWLRLINVLTFSFLSFLPVCNYKAGAIHPPPQLDKERSHPLDKLSRTLLLPPFQRKKEEDTPLPSFLPPLPPSVSSNEKRELRNIIRPLFFDPTHRGLSQIFLTSFSYLFFQTGRYRSDLGYPVRLPLPEAEQGTRQIRAELRQGLLGASQPGNNTLPTNCLKINIEFEFEFFRPPSTASTTTRDPSAPICTPGPRLLTRVGQFEISFKNTQFQKYFFKKQHVRIRLHPHLPLACAEGGQERALRAQGGSHHLKY